MELRTMLTYVRMHPELVEGCGELSHADVRVHKKA
jgi:hypothetical protein